MPVFPACLATTQAAPQARPLLGQATAGAAGTCGAPPPAPCDPQSGCARAAICARMMHPPRCCVSLCGRYERTFPMYNYTRERCGTAYITIGTKYMQACRRAGMQALNT